LSISKSRKISRWQLFNALCCFGSIPVKKINKNWLNWIYIHAGIKLYILMVY
jgi:hypothetical protein